MKLKLAPNSSRLISKMKFFRDQNNLSTRFQKHNAYFAKRRVLFFAIFVVMAHVKIAFTRKENSKLTRIIKRMKFLQNLATFVKYVIVNLS